MLMFKVAKTANGNCIYVLCIPEQCQKHFYWSGQLRMVRFFVQQQDVVKGLIYCCAVN